MPFRPPNWLISGGISWYNWSSRYVSQSFENTLVHETFPHSSYVVGQDVFGMIVTFSVFHIWGQPSPLRTLLMTEVSGTAYRWTTAGSSRGGRSIDTDDLGLRIWTKRLITSVVGMSCISRSLSTCGIVVKFSGENSCDILAKKSATSSTWSSSVMSGRISRSVHVGACSFSAMFLRIL